MNVYFVGGGGSDAATFAEQMDGKRALFSFVKCRSTEIPSTLAGYCLDSGAFTAWKQGHRIDIDRLLAWYERHDTADFKFTLDVIGGTEAQQKENLQIFDRAGQDVVPVFHGPGLESWRFFDELCERYPLVGIGSVVASNTSPLVTHWLNQIFNRVVDKETGRPRVRLHGLRMCCRMLEYPFDSVDGSAWATAAKNGRMPVNYGTRQTYAPPHRTRRELQNEWIEAWTNAPKCQTYRPVPMLFPDL